VFSISVLGSAQDRAALDAVFVRAAQLETSDPATANRLYEQAAQQGGKALSMTLHSMTYRSWTSIELVSQRAGRTVTRRERNPARKSLG